VKVDLSLVQGGILHDPSHAVLRALQELGTRWKATLVAEGVETAEQLAAIRELGFAAGQGYLLGRPSEERHVERLDLESLLPDGLFSRIVSGRKKLGPLTKPRTARRAGA
jgi:EAL domain-containing protein (putative c-di-GMP-specific phosphodiesterase class I)